MIENIDVEQAVEIFKGQWDVRKKEIISLIDANKRILAETLYAKETIPTVRASMMDGVAITGDNYTRDTSEWILGEDYVRADTGDDFPDKFDTVIAIENVNIEGGKLTWKDEFDFKIGMNIRHRGSTIEEDTLLLEKGTCLNSTNLALLAMGNHAEVLVYKKPKVVFIPTGSELVSVGSEISRGKNIDSNSIMVKSLLEEFGSQPILYPITKDDPKSLTETVNRALNEGDIILINGGSSKGEEDFSLRLLEQVGEVYFHWAQCGPGRPVAMAKVNDKPIFVVPGPAYGCFNVMQWLIGPCIRHLVGNRDSYQYKVKAKLKEPIKAPIHFKFLLGANVESDENGELLVTLLSFKEHGTPACLRANGFVHTNSNMKLSQVGSEIEVNLIKPVNE